ncbi:MAG: hypothetical protein CL555_11725 [Algoriphagus sp.]|nr:hypothetical protein [Algoriphagus sp.]
MRLILLCFLVIICQETKSQVKFGVYSEEELLLEEVSFQPEAKVVTLWEEANSYFMVNGLHTDFHYRFKLLDDNHDNFGDILINFYRGKSLVENIVKINAQVSYLKDGLRITELLQKDQIKEVNLGGGEFQYVLIFPNVKKGTIIEFTFKKIDHQFGILEGWSFQKKYPALNSKYTFKAPIFFQYQMIMQGKKVAEAAVISEKKNLYSWLRKDVPSLPEEPFVGNLINYQERVDGYLYSSEYVNPDELESSEMIYANWKQLANRWLDYEDMSSYFILNPESIPNYPNFKLDSLSELDQAKFLFDYVSKKIKLLNSSYLEPIYPLNDLIEKNEGNSFDKNLFLVHLLRRKGIQATLVMVNDKAKGREKLIEVPFINQFHSSIISTQIEGKNYLLDASDSITPFGLIPPSKMVEKGFFLEKDKGRLEELNHSHRSGSIHYITLENDSSGTLRFKNQIRFLDLKALEVGEDLRKLKEVEKFLSEEPILKGNEIKNPSISDQLSSSRSIVLTFDSFVGNESEETIFLKPIQFSEFNNNPFTQDSRILPIEFKYPYFENFNISIPIPEGFVLDDFPEQTSLTIPSKGARFSYLVELATNQLNVLVKLEIHKDRYLSEEYPDLKYFLESVSSKLNAPIVLRKSTVL